ncbi:hypothetical protein TrVFT333_002736 [Trichoderma virens FT-333]|nr:hypothetical protein TrVFT333_002736 [Trichoderma virens FT-333]
MKDDDQEQEQENEFSFVEYTDARLPSDPAVRNTQPKNPPALTFEEIPKASNSTQSSSSEAVSAGRVDAPAKAIVPITWKYLAGPTAPLPMSTLEATIAENFAILHLVESLSGLHLGVNAQASSIPRLGLHKLQLPQSKTLLSFITSRYGHVTPLTCAVDYLVARVRQITLKDDGFSEDRCLEVLHLYDKALKALQEAINDDEERKTPETLCAAELLGFFELLDGKSRAAHSWTRHAAGVAQLIQHQGADHFRTDFELALIAAYVGPLIHEAFLNHRMCFLVEDGWERVIREAICGNSSSSMDDSNTVLSLWSHLIEGPNLFKKVVQMVLSQDPVPPEAIQSVEEGLMADLQEIHGWLGMEYDTHNTNDPPQGTNGNFLTWHINFRQSIVSLQQQRYASWPILQGACITSWLTRARLFTALSPYRFRDLETVSQKFAYDIKSWRTNASSLVNEGLPGGLFMWQTVCAGRVNCKTNAIWTEGWSIGAYGRDRKLGGMIEREKFEAWCEAIGINVCREG